MLRALVFATLFLPIPDAAATQAATSVLHIRVAVADAAGTATPVPRHLLLISDNPPTASPRRVFTGVDGAAEVRLRPGNYTVESDEPFSFQGKAYQWIQTVDVVAGREATLTLTAANATIEAAATTTAPGSSAAVEVDPSSLATRWQNSVLALWSPTARGSGFVVHADGLIATNHRLVGSASSVEVQVTPTLKVAARVLASDPVRDVAVLLIDAKAAASAPPVPLKCDGGGKTIVADGQDLFALGAPLRQARRLTSGSVVAVEGRFIATDVALAPGSAGGPVFTAAGDVLGISTVDDSEGRGRGDPLVVRIELVCEVVAAAAAKMKEATVPSAAPLPMEPERPFPPDALKQAAAARRAGSVNAYRLSSSAYDVTLITPPLLYAAQNPSSQTGPTGTRRPPAADPRVVNPLDDFSNWSAYVADYPPVLLIRVTPRLVEGFWTKVARGAAQTQGVSIPPIKRFKPGFSRLQAFCGAAEVAPIHPFKLEQRVSESDAVYEGLYVFDPGALGPSCGGVRLVLYSEKEPDKGDTRAVDSNTVERVWQDFAPYRALK